MKQDVDQLRKQIKQLQLENSVLKNRLLLISEACRNILILVGTYKDDQTKQS